MPEQNPWNLIGCGVHKYARKGEQFFVAQQGVVVIEKDTVVLIQWFSWLSGEPLAATWHELLDFVDNEEWAFFENVECMKEYFEEHKEAIEEPHD